MEQPISRSIDGRFYILTIQITSIENRMRCAEFMFYMYMLRRGPSIVKK